MQNNMCSNPDIKHDVTRKRTGTFSKADYFLVATEGELWTFLTTIPNWLGIMTMSFVTECVVASSGNDGSNGDDVAVM